MRAVEPFAMSVHRRNDKMHSWLKTCGAPGTSLAARLIHGSATVTITIILLGSNALPQSESDRVGMSANELARRVVANELKFQKESSASCGKYLYPSLLKQDPRYYPSTSRSFLGRATYAASRILITRNDRGERRPNTSYFLGVLTSVAIATAYRPYWTRSASTTFKAFGSTIGSDAGANLFHELGLASGKW